MAQQLISVLLGNSPAKASRYGVPNGAGNWLTFELVQTKKYMIRHTGLVETSGADSLDKVKVGYSSSEPAAGVVEGDDDEILKIDDVIYPQRGTRYVSFKNISGTDAVLIQIREVETMDRGFEA